MTQQSVYNTNIFKLILLFIITISTTIKSHRIYNNQDSNEYYSYNEEKIYFTNKTNQDELKIGNENEVQQPSNTNIRENFISNTNSDKDTTRRSFNIYKNTVNNLDNDNSFPSVSKRVTDNSSDEDEERKYSSRQMSSNPTNQRIPPPSLISSPSSKSTLRVCEIKYAEYIQRIFPQESDIASDANDAEFNGRVLAAPGEYPHMAAVGFSSYDDKVDYKCGGSLISEKFVITAAHCVNITGLEPSKVRIGDLNLMVEESYLEPQLRNIKNIYAHPDYKTTAHYNDIALLELEAEVQLTEFVRPIRLWTKEALPFKTAYAMGYGSTDFAKQRTNRLTNLNMTIVPNDECNREMSKMSENESTIVSSQICAKDFVLNRDTCQGDSGGPLQLNIRGRRRKNRLHYHLIGLTSYGLFCRSAYPSIYTRVWSFLDWIEGIVWKDYIA